MKWRGLRRLAWRARRTPTHLLERHVRSRRLEREVRHVCGPPAVHYGSDEVLAICVVRNGALHLRSFIEHHLGLGIRHIVFLDNGSDDDTVAIACEHEHVTVLQSSLPYARYENVMKRYLARRFSGGRWNLCVDVDERFDYPFSGALPIAGFTRYLNEQRYTAVVAHMLDMLPADMTNDSAAGTGTDPRAAFPYYDLAGIRRTRYDWGRVADPGVRMHWGGVRHTLFGTNNGLSKAALVKVQDDTELFVDWHHVSDGSIADVTGVLLHYPFAGNFMARVREAVATRRYGFRTTDEYRRYLRGLEADPRMALLPPTARRLTRVDALLDESFLYASPAYRAWVLRWTGGSHGDLGTGPGV